MSPSKGPNVSQQGPPCLSARTTPRPQSGHSIYRDGQLCWPRLARQLPEIPNDKFDSLSICTASLTIYLLILGFRGQEGCVSFGGYWGNTIQSFALCHAVDLLTIFILPIERSSWKVVRVLHVLICTCTSLEQTSSLTAHDHPPLSTWFHSLGMGVCLAMESAISSGQESLQVWAGRDRRKHGGKFSSILHLEFFRGDCRKLLPSKNRATLFLCFAGISAYLELACVVCTST